VGPVRLHVLGLLLLVGAGCGSMRSGVSEDAEVTGFPFVYRKVVDGDSTDTEVLYPIYRKIEQPGRLVTWLIPVYWHRALSNEQGRNIVQPANAVIDDLGQVVADNRDSLASTLKNFDQFSTALNEMDENGRTPLQNVNRTLTELDAFAQALNEDGKTTLDRIERILTSRASRTARAPSASSSPTRRPRRRSASRSSRSATTSRRRTKTPPSRRSPAWS